jgi:hypothetical protein
MPVNSTKTLYGNAWRTILLTLTALWLLGAGASHELRAQDVDAGPYVPTPQYIVDRMLQMGSVSGKDYLIDLGSGDGRIVITAAKRFGAHGMGVDISEKLVDLAMTNAHKEQVADRVKFVRQDAFKTDIAPASVLTLYLLPKFVLELRPKLLSELKPGSRIVCHDYSLGDWESDNSITFDSPEKEAINGASQTSLFLYIVPALVAGTWQLALPEGLGARSAQVSLQQRYQRISGSTSGARSKPMRHAALRGDRIELTLPIGSRDYLAAGRVSGDRIEGTVDVPGRGKLPFSATRTAAGTAVGWQ